VPRRFRRRDMRPASRDVSRNAAVHLRARARRDRERMPAFCRHATRCGNNGNSVVRRATPLSIRRRRAKTIQAMPAMSAETARYGLRQQIMRVRARMRRRIKW